jgi:hypothetical protein
LNIGDKNGRRFPRPWDIEEINKAAFVVRDNNGQALACVYLRMSPAGARLPACSRATKRGVLRRISQNYRSCLAPSRGPRRMLSFTGDSARIKLSHQPEEPKPATTRGA